ncbi:hypothetical protein LPJ78_002528 [Coemansia sp. RSA 989]|nr:hypothetical protein LPJ78_002528 [Coemansia sp. RSA 989]KAJ2669668.1 hypothetical protein IWW42_004436 [Coemansia sp. RSA 1085]
MSTAKSPSGMRALPRSITGANTLSPIAPTASVALTSSGLAQPIVLTPGQFAVDCGGVLLDPGTNEVCLLFYPDSSEWRLPMGRSQLMGGSEKSPVEPSTAGCEPMAHAAQRLISEATGYRCSHLHPSVSQNAPQNACAYIGPQMVEPLALQIEHRKPESPRGSPDPFDFSETGLLSDSTSQTDMQDAREGQAEPEGSSSGLAESDSGYQPRSSQFVMTYYYMAWLAQNRFESRAATHPVGPASEESQEPGQQPRALPLAEVTWFKVDTAAQVLTNAPDKAALREAINRLTRLALPEPPFTFAEALVQKEPKPASLKPEVAEETESCSSASLSDGATKAENSSAAASRMLMAPASSNSRNMDILRKTATSIGKRSGSIFKKRANSSEEDRPQTQPSAAASPGQKPILVARRNTMPRMFSIFYKMVGSSA